jgi:hypothetical protein
MPGKPIAISEKAPNSSVLISVTFQPGFPFGFRSSSSVYIHSPRFNLRPGRAKSPWDFAQSEFYAGKLSAEQSVEFRARMGIKYVLVPVASPAARVLRKTNLAANLGTWMVYRFLENQMS